MTALTQDRLTSERPARLVSDPLAAGAVIFAGGMYVLDATGAASAATAAATTAVRAVALQRANAAEGASTVQGQMGCFCFDNSAGAAALTRADIGADCYAADDCTVKKTGTCLAGKVFDVDERGVWVRLGLG